MSLVIEERMGRFRSWNLFVCGKSNRPRGQAIPEAEYNYREENRMLFKASYFMV
jgi:hypothetical protein